MNDTTKKVLVWVGGIFGGGLGLTILGLAVNYWILLAVTDQVAEQLADAGIVPKEDVQANTTRSKQNEKDIVRVESKAERIAQILMED